MRRRHCLQSDPLCKTQSTVEVLSAALSPPGSPFSCAKEASPHWSAALPPPGLSPLSVIGRFADKRPDRFRAVRRRHDQPSRNIHGHRPRRCQTPPRVGQSVWQFVLIGDRHILLFAFIFGDVINEWLNVIFGERCRHLP
jgi:hypothetical protein